MIGRCLILLLISCGARAQPYTSANFQAMGGAGVALYGIHSLTSNPAGLNGLLSPHFSIAYQQHFLLNDVATTSALFGMPTRFGAFGLALMQYGLKDTYRDSKASLTYARLFGRKFSTSLTVNYHQLQIVAYQVVQTTSLDVGFQYAFSKAFTLGIHSANLSSSRYGNELYGSIPSTFKMGGAYHLPNLMITSEGIWQQEEGLRASVGISYGIAEKFFLRGGLASNPMRRSAGFGIHWKGFVCDAAATFHPQLGMSPQIGLSYAL